MFKKKNDGNGEKIFRYSIRKYHFGAASVAVAALMFFANGVQAQAPAVSSATASDVVAGSAGNSDGEPQESDGEEPEKVSQTEPSAELQSAGESNSPETKIEDASKGQETAGLVPTKPETKPAAQETSQGGAVKEQDQPTSATKTTEAKSLQGNLQALLEKLTLSSMKALHDEVEAGLAAAKAVLDDPKATQAQVDEQVRAMEELTSRVNQALEPSLPKLTDLGEASSTNNKLVEPNGTATEQATGGKRRKRGGTIEPGAVANQVSPTDGGKEAAPEANSQSTPRELPTYTNTTEGENGVYRLKDELESIVKRLKENQASEDKIQAAKAAADKFNEAFSKGDTISQEDFAAALVDLKKSRDLIEGVLEEKYGEETTAGGVTPQPRDGGYSDFRSSRVTRAARAGENYSEAFRTAQESYFEKSGDRGNSPYDKYTYVFYSNRKYRDNSTKLVSEAEKYIKATVTSTEDGFHWDIEINNQHRRLPGNTQVWFTVPSGQEFKHNSDAFSITEKSGGTTTRSPNTSSILELLRDSRAQFGRVTKGTTTSTGVNNRFTLNPMPSGSLNDLARRGPRGTNPYERRAESRENQKVSDGKFDIINSSRGELYYFELPNSDRKYRLSFNTVGNNDVKKLVYAFGLRGREGAELFLANQWHARTYAEAKGDAKDEIEKARQRKNDSLGKNGSLSSVERDGATAIVNTYARQATRDIENADSLIKVDDALHKGLENINGVNPIGKDLPKEAIKQAANTKRGEIDKQAGLTDEE
ncbi:YSIRK-type signal peptide-containing protein, partial [Streptococcus pseudopneumoniae]